MNLTPLTPNPVIRQDTQAAKNFHTIKQLIAAIDEREIPESVIVMLNAEIDQINAIAEHTPKPEKLIRKSTQKIIQHLEKELKIVPKKHYQNLWMILGMSVFGLPLGVALGFSTDNMGILGVGLPIGMAIGLAVGAQMDKKAKAEGRQLDVEVK